MKSIIKEILCGKCFNSEQIAESEEYSRLDKKAIEIYEKLINDIPAEFRAVLSNLYHTFDQREIEATHTYFVEGVKLGILLGIETCN